MDADGADGSAVECDPNAGVGASAGRQYPELGWRWFYGQSAEDVEDRVDEGYRIVDLEVDSVDPYTFSVALVENSGRMQKGWWWYYGQSKSQLDQQLNDNNARLIDLEVQQIGDARVFAGVMIENVGDDEITNWRYILDAAPDTIVDDALADDMRLIDADPWQSDAGATHSASWSTIPGTITARGGSTTDRTHPESTASSRITTPCSRTSTAPPTATSRSSWTNARPLTARCGGSTALTGSECRSYFDGSARALSTYSDWITRRIPSSWSSCRAGPIPAPAIQSIA